MAREAQGIEIFGRGARVVETDDPPRPRTALVGLVALALAITAAVALAFGVQARAIGDLSPAFALAIAALASSILAVLGGLFALVTGRGRRVGLVAVVLGLVANPWLLSLVLGYFGALAGS